MGQIYIGRWASFTSVATFMDDMRDVRDSNYQENKRALSAIFYLANIKTDRHGLDFSEL
ncbi:DUF5347 family protein [Candidatus Erwinia dacicola]